MYKKLIITGSPRTGTTALVDLLNLSEDVLVFNELALFHPGENQFNEILENYCIEYQETLIRKNIFKSNLSNFELIGDKHPNYCLDYNLMSNIIKKYKDYYFIFTYRNPCATVYSILEKSKKIIKEGKPEQTYTSFDSALNKVIQHNLNWSTILYPEVKNKIIINYDYYNQKTSLLIQKLENFLNINLNIENKKYFSNKNSDIFKSKFSKNTIFYIENKFNPIKKHINNLLFN
jgi:hypothetical protein